MTQVIVSETTGYGYKIVVDEGTHRVRVYGKNRHTGDWSLYSLADDVVDAKLDGEHVAKFGMGREISSSYRPTMRPHWMR